MEKSVQEYNRKLEHYYDSDGRLMQYPSKKPMRIIALIKIAGQIDADRKYTEKEINEIIRQNIAFSDIELIRRELYQYKFLGRLKDGSEYWVEDGWRTAYAGYMGEDQADSIGFSFKTGFVKGDFTQKMKSPNKLDLWG